MKFPKVGDWERLLTELGIILALGAMLAILCGAIGSQPGDPGPDSDDWLMPLITVTTASASSTPDSDLGPRVVAFHEPYNRFMREFLGCPKGAREVEECDPKRGSIDYGEFNKARKAAKALFDLRD